MQRTSGWAFSSQRVMRGRRAIIELTFQVAIFISIWSAPAERCGDGALECRDTQTRGRRSKAPSSLRSAGAFHKSQRRDQSGQKRAAQRNIVGEDMLMRRVCTIALNA